jgi:hypothetical protein
MLMTKERGPEIRTLRGWAISVLREAGAVRGCEEHGRMQDRADPHARALLLASQDPLSGASPASAVAGCTTYWTRSATLPGMPAWRMKNRRKGGTARFAKASRPYPRQE